MTLENITAEELHGWYFCYCGCKYWEDVAVGGPATFTLEPVCISCGEHASVSVDNPKNK